MNRPNIFQFAKKELSQDAIVCWLLACLDSESHYREIGLQFIRFLFQDNTIDAKDVRLADGPYPQYHRIDVYAVVLVRGLLYPIIVEDKTNTYLHDGQMQTYCKKIADWMSPSPKKNPYLDSLKKKLGGLPRDWGGILYVYFKTGYPSGWEKKDLHKQANSTVQYINEIYDRDLLVREIYLDDMRSFLSEQINQSPSPDTLLVDYSKILEGSAKRRNFVCEHLLADAKGCDESLSDENGCNEMASIRLMERIFGESCEINYNYQKWASHALLKITDPAGNETWYNFHFEWCALERKQGAYAFQLQQWRSEKEISTAKEEALKNKTEEGKQIQEICREIVNTLAVRYPQVIVKWEGPKEYPCKKSYDSQMLMRVFITGESKPIDVCNFLKDFSAFFVSKVNEVFGKRASGIQDRK